MPKGHPLITKPCAWPNCETRLRSDNKSGYCRPHRLAASLTHLPVTAPISTCGHCGKKLRRDNATGFCRDHQTYSAKAVARRNDPSNKAKLKEHSRARREEFRKRVDDIRLKSGCMDCGYNENPAALDFDHRPGTVKLGAVCKMHDRPWEKVLEEIAKCDIVCANCHRIRTVTRLGVRYDPV